VGHRRAASPARRTSTNPPSLLAPSATLPAQGAGGHRRTEMRAGDAGLVCYLLVHQHLPVDWAGQIPSWGSPEERTPDFMQQQAAGVRMVRRLLSGTPELTVEVSMRRSLGAALEALGSGELDACFGRVHDLDPPLA
jgi:hypothetical protein